MSSNKRKGIYMDYPFDYAGWQERLKLTNQQAAQALDISLSFFAALKRNGKGRRIYAWAAYGIECAARAAGAV